MTTAQDRLATLLRERIAPAMRDRGYRGSGQSFHRRFDGHWGVVSVQKSQWGSREATTFTVNLGVASDVVLTGRGDDATKAPAEPACQWRERLGVLVDGRDAWWEVAADTTDETLAALAATILAALDGTGLPAIEAHAGPEAMLAAVLGTAGGEGTGWGGLDAAGLLLAAHGGTEEQRARFAKLVDDGRAHQRRVEPEPRPKTGPARTKTALSELGHARPDRRADAAYLLGSSKALDVVVPALRRALTDPDDRVRVAAATSLLDLDDVAGLDGPLAVLATTPDRQDAGVIAAALARIAQRHDDLRPRIIDALEHRLETAVGVDLVGVGVALERLTGARV